MENIIFQFTFICSVSVSPRLILHGFLDICSAREYYIFTFCATKHVSGSCQLVLIAYSIHVNKSPCNTQLHVVLDQCRQL